MWKRAPSYFDVCLLTQAQEAARTVSHNLGAVPEMIWAKSAETVSVLMCLVGSALKDLPTPFDDSLSLQSSGGGKHCEMALCCGMNCSAHKQCFFTWDV